MRKITTQVRAAFNHNCAASLGNTQISVTETISPKCKIVAMILHGHTIARKFIPENGATRLVVSNCGYATNVTKDRLNAITGIYVNQRRGEWYLNGEAWDGEAKTIEVKY